MRRMFTPVVLVVAVMGALTAWAVVAADRHPVDRRGNVLRLDRMGGEVVLCGQPGRQVAGD